MKTDILNIIGSIVIPILAVFLGGWTSYIVVIRESRRNNKIELYLDFLNCAQKRYHNEYENIDDYFDSLRKLILVASPDLIKVLNKYEFIPKREKEWSPYPENNNAIQEIILIMRKELGDKPKVIKEIRNMDINCVLIDSKTKI